MVLSTDNIARYRGELEDLLWDFDDFLTADDFDVAKFDELQRASRNAAPAVPCEQERRFAVP